MREKLRERILEQQQQLQLQQQQQQQHHHPQQQQFDNNNNSNNHHGSHHKKSNSISSIASSDTATKSGVSVIFRKCSFFLCNRYETEPKQFKICQRCRSPYCSQECQIRDWQQGNHKSYCKQFVPFLPSGNKNY